MNIRFDDQVVVVTGASTGIGAAIAQGFGAAGARVVVHYNQSAAAAEAVASAIQASGGAALRVQGDVTDPDTIRRVLDATLSHWGRIDVLVNNAGALLGRVAIAAMTDAQLDAVFDLNTRSVFQFTKQIIPIMQRQQRGSIINVTSISARNGGGGGSVAYAAAKAAVSTLTRGLARELAGDHIRVNAISPGVILTPFHERYTEPERMQQIIATIPMGRAGTANECVGATLFLAHDALSSYITGQIIEINGGQYMP